MTETQLEEVALTERTSLPNKNTETAEVIRTGGCAFGAVRFSTAGEGAGLVLL